MIPMEERMVMLIFNALSCTSSGGCVQLRSCEKKSFFARLHNNVILGIFIQLQLHRVQSLRRKRGRNTGIVVITRRIAVNSPPLWWKII